MLTLIWVVPLAVAILYAVSRFLSPAEARRRRDDGGGVETGYYGEDDRGHHGDGGHSWDGGDSGGGGDGGGD